MSLDDMTNDEIKSWTKGMADAFAAVKQNGLWLCPECKGLMPDPPKDYNICPCCNVEFGYDAKEQEGIQLWNPASLKKNGAKKDV